MNYYIQGNKEKADKIKSAFEKLGYDTSRHLFNAESVLYFTLNGEIRATTCNCTPAIIKTHPDYKELELPAKAKFKEGDWIACDADSFTLSIKSVKDGNYYFHQGASLPIKAIDEHYHLWSIQDAEDGDVLASDDGFIMIVKESRGSQWGWRLSRHCALLANGFFEVQEFHSNPEKFHPATKEQRDLLFTKMNEVGYQWDANKKELRKIKPHYDIANFKPFDKVLTRDTEHGNWNVNLFSYYIKDEKVIAHFRCINSLWIQCIPFDDDTKHLLGTTDMPDEMYINW